MYSMGGNNSSWDVGRVFNGVKFGNKLWIIRVSRIVPMRSWDMGSAFSWR